MQGLFQGLQIEPDGSSRMRRNGKRIFGIVLLMAAFLLPSRAPASELSQGAHPSGAEVKASIEGPDLADIIPQAVKLSGRLMDLERELKDEADVSTLEKKCTAIETNMKGYPTYRDEPVNGVPVTQLIRMHSSVDRPNDAFFAVPYHQHWF